MSLKDMARDANVEKIIDLINDAAKHGQYEVDLNSFDISFSNDMIDDIKAAFDEDEISFSGQTVKW